MLREASQGNNSTQMSSVTTSATSSNNVERKTTAYRKSLVRWFFEPVDGVWKDEAGEGKDVATKFKCRVEHCKQIRCQDQGNGNGNLIHHLGSEGCCGNNFYSLFEDARARKDSGGLQTTLSAYVSDETKNLYGWCDLLTAKLTIPFSSSEDPAFLKYSKLTKVSTEKLMNTMERTSEILVENIKEKVKGKLGCLIMDCYTCSQTKTHFMGLFWAQQHPTALDDSERVVADLTLLACTPPQDETEFGALNFEELIRTTCTTYDINIDEQCICLVSDNTHLNPAISKKLEKPFIGCASHRFELAVTAFIQKDASNMALIDKVNDLMIKLKTLKKIGKLRQSMSAAGLRPLMPKSKCPTRWGSLHDMLKRYVELEPYLDQTDAELLPLLPTAPEYRKISRLLHDLEPFRVLTIKLQSERGITLSDRDQMFARVVNKHPSLVEQLGLNSAIIQKDFRPFEQALVALQQGLGFERDENGELTSFGKQQQLSVQPLLKVPAENNNDDNDDDEEAEDSGSGSSNANAFLLTPPKAKRQRKHDNGDEDPYMDMNWIPITSNVVERLFSKAKLAIGNLRASMSPYHLEMLLFLRLNKDLWSIKTVAKALAAVDSV